MTGLRERRIGNEWSALKRLETFNPLLISVQARESGALDETFHLKLDHTPSPVPAGAAIEIAASHPVVVRYPAYFPAVPLEVFLDRPVVHPNVHPRTGFVCIWNRTSPGDSILHALVLLQRVIAWELRNTDANHVMQPDAAERWIGPSPLAYRPLLIPPDLRAELDTRCAPPAARRRRLFSGS